MTSPIKSYGSGSPNPTCKNFIRDANNNQDKSTCKIKSYSSQCSKSSADRRTDKQGYVILEVSKMLLMKS